MTKSVPERLAIIETKLDIVVAHIPSMQKKIEKHESDISSAKKIIGVLMPLLIAIGIFKK